MRYFMVGVNGAGKTTLLNKIKENFPDTNIIKGSQYFMDYLGISGDYEALRRIPNEEANGRLREMLKKLLEENNNFIFDAHLLNIVRGEVKKVYEDWVKDFDAIILLKISAETALKRIRLEQRDRALFPEGTSEEECLNLYRKYISDYESEFNKIITGFNMKNQIINGEGSIEDELSEYAEFNSRI